MSTGLLASAGPRRAVLFLAAPRQPLPASTPDRQPARPSSQAEGGAIRECGALVRRAVPGIVFSSCMPFMLLRSGVLVFSGSCPDHWGGICMALSSGRSNIAPHFPLSLGLTSGLSLFSLSRCAVFSRSHAYYVDSHSASHVLSCFWGIENCSSRGSAETIFLRNCFIRATVLRMTIASSLSALVPGCFR